MMAFAPSRQSVEAIDETQNRFYRDRGPVSGEGDADTQERLLASLGMTEVERTGHSSEEWGLSDQIVGRASTSLPQKKSFHILRKPLVFDRGNLAERIVDAA
jgi:hypothetical protein